MLQICMVFWGQSQQLIIPTGHINGVRHCTFSSEGKYFVTTGYDQTARIHEMLSGKDVMIFQGVSYAEFSPNGKLILTVCLDNTIRIYNFSEGKEVYSLKGHAETIRTAVFSPNGKQVLASVNDGLICIYNLSNGKEEMLLKANSAVYSPDGNLVLAPGDTTKIYDLSNKREMSIFSYNSDEYSSGIQSGVFSPDGKLAVIKDNNRKAWFFDVASGNLIYQKDGQGPSPFGEFSMNFSPNGKFFLHKEDGFEMAQLLENNSDSTIFFSAKLGVYEASSGQRIREIVTNAKEIRCAFYSPDGRLILIQCDSLVRIFDATSGNEMISWEIDKSLTGCNGLQESVVFSPDGKWIVAKGCNMMLVYDAHDAREMYRLVGQSYVFEGNYFTPDGSHVITSWVDGGCEVREFLSNKVVQFYSSSRSVFSSDKNMLILFNSNGDAAVKETLSGRDVIKFKGVRNAEFSSNGQFILIVGLDNKVRVFNVLTGVENKKITYYENQVVNACISPDGNFLFNEFEIDGNIEEGELASFTGVIFDLHTGEIHQYLQKNIHERSLYENGEIDAISTKLYSTGASYEPTVYSSFSPNGNKLLKVGYKTSVYNLAADTTIDLSGAIQSAEFSPDGNYILANSEDFASLFESNSGLEFQKYAEKFGKVDYVKFSPDGQKILVSCKAGVIIYETLSGQQLHILKGHLSILNPELLGLGIEQYFTLTSAEFSPDGRYVMTAGYDNKTIVWDLATGDKLFTRVQFNNDDWLVYDEDYRFDGSPGALKKLFIMCGLDVLEIEEFIEDLHVPGIIEKILRGAEIKQNKMNVLKVCRN